MSSKAELRDEIERLSSALALARQDEEDIHDRVWELENRHILVSVRRDSIVIDAMIIPPSGRASTPIVVDPVNDPNGDDVELWTEVVE